MAREAMTYRAARRNFCKQERMMWGANWYYSQHSARYHRATVLSRAPSKYHPLADVKAGWGRFRAELASKLMAVAGATATGVALIKPRATGRGR